MSLILRQCLFRLFIEGFHHLFFTKKGKRLAKLFQNELKTDETFVSLFCVMFCSFENTGENATYDGNGGATTTSTGCREGMDGQ